MTATSMITHATPLGQLTLAASEVGLTRATFHAPRGAVDPADAPSTAVRGWLDLARRELDEYFTGERREFTVPVDLRRVNPLHRRVLDGVLAHVGYGQTTSYGALATALGLVEDGARQVGAAMARNPLLIVVPCHRVLGAGGKLVGYAAGLDVKQRLLDIETHDRTPQLDLAR